MERYLQVKYRKIILSTLISLTVLLGLLVLVSDTAYSADRIPLWKTALTLFSTEGQSAVYWIICAVTLMGILAYLIFAVIGIASAVKDRKEYVYTLYAGIVIFLMLILIGPKPGVFGGGAAAGCIINIILCLAGLAYHYICVRLGAFRENVDAKEQLSQKQKNGKLILTVSAVLSCISILALFVTPFAGYMSFAHAVSDEIVPINALKGAESMVRFCVFLGTVAALLVSLSFLFRLLARVTGSAEGVVSASRALVYCNLILSVVYYISGYIYAYVRMTKGTDMIAEGYFPIVLAVFFALIYAVVRGLYFPEVSRSVNTPLSERMFRAIMMVFTAAFTVCTMSTLLMNIVVAKYSYSSGQKKVVINGIKLLRGYADMSKGYRTLAFVILTVLVLSAALLLAALMAYIGRSRIYNRISVIAVTVNVLGTTVVGICGKYFEMVQAINADVIYELLGAEASIAEALDIGFKVTSDAYIPMLVSLGLLIVLLLTAPITRMEKRQPAAEISQTASGKSPVAVPQGEHTEQPDYDACPAFTELDGRIPDFEKDIEVRSRSSFEIASLPDIVKFIVRYAADCRLHLSYREEDIADFVAGLGATRLTILQGMSGTGKTSLPKIVSEALMGGCDVIEVESSWRDKNELLGYYNEFSKTYTPRKFTQALYKAKLNPDIPTFIVLDEMNLSRIEYYFSDFLSLMENEEDKREIKLLNVKLYRIKDHEICEYAGLVDGHTMHIPRNVWFVGTANRDESTFAISDKVYDRAHTMNFRRRAQAVTGSGDIPEPRFLSFTVLERLLYESSTPIGFDVEQNETVHRVEQLLAPFNVSFGNRVARQIESYVKTYCRCFREPEARLQEALENILLSEVVSKLENKTVENKAALAAEFNKLCLHRCAAFIRELNEEYL